MNAADVLDQAADILERDGWTQGEWGFTGQPHCIDGGLIAAANTDADYSGALEAIAVHLRTTHLLAWNDADGRTADEVLAALRDTAADLRHAPRGTA